MSVTFDLVLPQGCPLAGASETARDAYRVVKTAPPTGEDLLTYQELGLLPKANPCKRASVSLFSSYEGAKHRLELSPHLGEHIAIASLTPSHGQLSDTHPASGHIDWWPYAGMRRPSDFQVVES